MKKSRIFAAVVYFIFTFGIGIVFSLTLPGYFATFTVPAEVIEDALEREDFLTGIVLSEPIGFYRTPVLDCKFEEGGGVVLYEAVMEVYDRNASQNGGTEETESGLTHGMLYKCYEGFLYGVGDRYDTYGKQGNGTSLRVTSGDGTVTVLSLLDYDADGDGINDGISTYRNNGFLLLEIREGEVPSIRSMEFTDRRGEVVFTASADEVLNFESSFFDRFGDIGEYNGWVAAGGTGVSSEESQRLSGLRNDYVKAVVDSLGQDPGCAVTAQAEEYKAASKTISKRASAKAAPFIVIYFVAIYIIADFLLGSHYIIKFFKWFLFGVCKIPHKEKTRAGKEVFGHDYYCMVTLRLDVEEVPEFHGSVQIKYSEGGEEFAFSLLKEDGYTATLRMKAGVYGNPFIDIDRAYAPIDLPDNLEVEGYAMEKTVKIVRREE